MERRFLRTLHCLSNGSLVEVMKKVVLKIQQTLHGYDDGHRLLAASCRLSSSAQQVLIEQSDLSGASVVAGFESYLSAFPVEDEGYYCLSRTWDAPEMTRPGCVWTHSLLIPFSELPFLDFDSVLELPHRRPKQKDCDFSDYGVPISQESAGRVSRLSENYLVIAGLIAESWAMDPSSTLYMGAASSEVYEMPLFLMWCGQWPKLRRTFSFSTGSLRDRKGSGFAYDIQVFPENQAQLFKRSIRKAGRFFNPDLFDGRLWSEKLVARAMRLRDQDQEVYEFVFRYGADVLHPKAAIVVLIDLFRQLHAKSKNARAIIATVSSGFPSKIDAATLKRDLLVFPSKFFSTKEQVAMLGELQLTKGIEAFEIPENAIPARVVGLWQKHSHDVLAVTAGVMSERPTPQSQQFLDAVAGCLRVEDLDLLRKEVPSGWAYFAAKNRRITLSPKSWEVSPREQISLLKAIKACSDEGDEFWIPILQMFLQRDSEELADFTAAHLPKTLLAAYKLFIKDRLKKGGSILDVFPCWRRSLRDSFLAEHSERLNREIKDCESLFCSWLFLLPKDYLNLTIGGEMWSQAFAIIVNLPDSTLKTEGMFLIVALGLSLSPAPDIEILLAASKFVNRRLAMNDCSDRAWRHLEPYLPHLEFWQEWDRCEKLRAALFDLYPRQKARFKDITGQSKGKKIREWIVNFLGSSRS